MRDATETFGQRFAAAGLAVLTVLVLVFLVAPILIIVPLSFSSGSFFFYPLPGFSLRWYQDFFTSTFWLPSVWNSLIVGVSATLLATLLGTLAALGMWRARFPGQGLILALIISPMVVPVIIIAVGVYFAFAPLGLTDGYAGLILAHTRWPCRSSWSRCWRRSPASTARCCAPPPVSVPGRWRLSAA